MKDIPKISEEAVEEIREFARDHHEGQKRQQRSIIDGAPYDYFTHITEVTRRAAFLLQIVHVPKDENEIVEHHPEVIEIIAICHDLVEDCMSEMCKDACPLNGRIHQICNSLFRELEEKLKECDVHPRLIAYIRDGIRLLTKNHHLPKEEQDPDMWKNLSTAPLIIKLIKLGDNWHNLESIAVRGLQKALRNYNKIRKSWEVIFSEEELITLYHARLLEPPNVLRVKTEVLEWIYACLFEDGDENDAEMYEKYQSLFSVAFNGLTSFDVLKGDSMYRLRFVCEPSMSRITKLVDIGDTQIYTAARPPHEILYQLQMAKMMPLSFSEMFIRNCIHQAELEEQGESSFNISFGGEIENAHAILYALEMTGEEFIRDIKTEEKFHLLLDAAIQNMENKSR